MAHDTQHEVDREATVGGHAWLALAILTLVYVLNVADRYVLAVIQEQLKSEYRLGDWHIGLLGGPAFTLFYTACGLPIARYAERAARVRVIGAAIAVWSAMTVVCGMATSLAMLVAGRFGVAIGEAGSTPPSHSLIADYFPPARRASALGIYSSGLPLGTMLVALVGGWIAQHHGWRMVFLSFGLPGLAMALVLLATVREPTRQGTAPIPDFGSAIRALWSRRTYRLTLAAATIFSFANEGVTLFLAAFLARTHHLDLQQSTLVFGVAQGVFAFGGIILGGLLVDRFQPRWASFPAWLCGIGNLVGAAAMVAAFLADDLTLAIAALMLAKLAQWLTIGPTFGMIQSVAPEGARATAQAIYLFAVSIGGAALGPMAFGALSDMAAAALAGGMACDPASQLAGCVTARANGLRLALSTSCAIFALAGVVFLRVRPHLASEAALR